MSYPQNEITQLRWSDNDADALTGVVRRLKDPSGQRLNVRFKYTQEAWDIANRQPKVDECIFPFNGKSISASFTRTCEFLNIKDLRFHDLRHNAVTALFKAGYSIHEVPHFSLHRSLTSLMRYYNEDPADIELK